MKHYDYFMNNALQITDELRYYAYEGDSYAFPVVCHGDYQYHNILRTETGNLFLPFLGKQFLDLLHIPAGNPCLARVIIEIHDRRFLYVSGRLSRGLSVSQYSADRDGQCAHQLREMRERYPVASNANIMITVSAFEILPCIFRPYPF